MSKPSRWFQLVILLALPILWRSQPPPPARSIPAGITAYSPSLATVAPLNAVSVERANHFNEFAQQTLLELPTQAILIGRTDFHQPPSEVLQGGEAVGRIAEWLESHQNDRESGKEFFRVCAERDAVLTAVRALCLKRFLEMGGERNSQFSERLLWLADQLPSTITRE